jgi:DNA-binding transcriptional regulator YiaG
MAKKRKTSKVRSTVKKRRENGMDKTEFKAIIASLGLSERAAAPVLGVSVRQTQRFAWGDSKIPSPVRKLMRAVKKHNITAEELAAL